MSARGIVRVCWFPACMSGLACVAFAHDGSFIGLVFLAFALAYVALMWLETRS